jgi:GMP synthase (glutamine-hydrolysing)
MDSSEINASMGMIPARSSSDRKSMSFQSVKFDAPTVLHLPDGKPAAAAKPRPAKSLLPVLIVLHQETSSPGRVGNALRALGHELDIRRPRFGDRLPETLDGHAGAVIFGGPMSANDSDEYIRQEIDWIAVPLQEQRPYLGICLGAQMLAIQLGARVAPHPQGRAQIGYYPIRPTPAGLKICPHWPNQVYHWHREGFELPGGAELLAEGCDFPVEAFRADHAFGFQFHPDVTFAMMCRWTTRGHARLELPGARPRHHHFADRAVYDVIERAWLKEFLDGWLTRAPVSVVATPRMAEAAE